MTNHYSATARNPLRHFLNQILLATNILVFGLLVEAFAQVAPAPTRDPAKLEELKKQFEEISTRLKLTQDQKEKVRPIIMDSMEQMRAVTTKYKAQGRSIRTMRAMKKEIDRIDSSTDAKLSAFLSPEQMSEMSKIREERRAEKRAELRDGQS